MDSGPLLSIGHGLDAHRLVPGLPLWLGGLRLDHPLGLLGHSDGDCAAHALADALLGGAGLGGLGDHFPSSDEQWRGITGLRLLERCAGLLVAARWQVVSAHVVVVAEAPHLAPHLGAMGDAMSAALGLTSPVVRVGATSTDGLGMTGRGEGIAASAVVLLSQR